MYRGSMVALVTPMHSDESIDWAALERLVEFHVEQGTTAIVSVGTTGESATLDIPEHTEVIKATVKYVNGRIPVIAGTGANSTTEALELTMRAKHAGAEAALMVTPYYNKPTQEGMYLHYRKIAESVDIPVILYNVPARTAVDLLPETVARLSEIQNIIGIKDATGDLSRVKQTVELCGTGFDLYSGDDATGMEFMLLGGHGVVSVTSNIVPAQMSEMCVAALQGNRVEAEQINQKIANLHNDLFLEANPIPVKWALYEMGLIETGIRLPLTPLAEPFRPNIVNSLNKSGVPLH